MHLEFKRTQIRFSREVSDKYTHISCVVVTTNKFIPMLITSMVKWIFSSFRETFWRITPSIEIDRQFDCNVVLYRSDARFSTGKWFGKKFMPRKLEESICYGLRKE